MRLQTKKRSLNAVNTKAQPIKGELRVVGVARLVPGSLPPMVVNRGPRGQNH
jgi:hypothetical protein